MIHTIKINARRQFEIELSGNKQAVVLAVLERDSEGLKHNIDALEFMGLDLCQALIFDLTETAERLKKAAA